MASPTKKTETRRRQKQEVVLKRRSVKMRKEVKKRTAAMKKVLG